MTEKKLTGNEMFELVKKECQRIIGKVGVKGKKRQKGVLYGRSVNGKWGWYGLGDEEKDSKYVGKTKNGKPNGQGTQTWSDFGDKYVGEWENGKRCNGTEYNKYGKINGNYVNGKYKTNRPRKPTPSSHVINPH